MAKDSPEAKFVDDLPGTLDLLPSDDIVMVLGDFNAHIGKRETEDNVWREVRGLHMGLTLIMKLENNFLNCVLLII